MEIKVFHQVMDWNEDVSDEIKKDLSDKKVCMINVMGSPGAGKTSLITEVVNKLSGKYRIGVIEGDIAGQIDAEKMKAMGLPVVQLDTDGACHIEAMSIQHILPEFNLEDLDVLFVENIGNLDKVEKYPLMFSTTDALVLNKYDMMQYFDFDEKRVESNAIDVNPDVSIFKVSSRNGDGMDDFAKWLSAEIDKRIR